MTSSNEDFAPTDRKEPLTREAIELRIAHHSTCNPNYPEKPKGEKPQDVSMMDMGDFGTSYTCGDCGAFVLVQNDEIVQKEPA